VVRGPQFEKHCCIRLTTETSSISSHRLKVKVCTVPEGSRRLRLQISGQSAHEDGKVSPTARSPLPPGNIPSTYSS
jgi:hypothetical protein